MVGTDSYMTWIGIGSRYDDRNYFLETFNEYCPICPACYGYGEGEHHEGPDPEGNWQTEPCSDFPVEGAYWCADWDAYESNMPCNCHEEDVQDPCPNSNPCNGDYNQNDDPPPPVIAGGDAFSPPITNEDGSMGPPNLMGEESPMRKPPNNPDPDPDPEQEPQDTGSGNTIPPDPTQQPGSGRP